MASRVRHLGCNEGREGNKQQYQHGTLPASAIRRMTGAESAELECQRQSTEPSGRYWHTVGCLMQPALHQPVS